MSLVSPFWGRPRAGPEGDLTYPEDYPELGAEITVVGEFQAYEENGMTGYHLINARLEPSEMR